MLHSIWILRHSNKIQQLFISTISKIDNIESKLKMHKVLVKILSLYCRPSSLCFLMNNFFFFFRTIWRYADSNTNYAIGNNTTIIRSKRYADICLFFHWFYRNYFSFKSKENKFFKASGKVTGFKSLFMKNMILKNLMEY